MRRLLLDLRRRAQSRAIRALRRSRFFPRTVVDRLGEDARLGETRLDAAVLVYFPGAPDVLYQVQPWIPTFEAVHQALGVVVVCQDSRVADDLRRRSSVPVRAVARYGTLDGLLARSDVKLALYVSHDPRNFECLRFASLLHAYIGHGDSDKGVSASNQLKAYDLVLAPGDAALERIAARLMRYDVAAHGVVVGQPRTLAAPAAPRQRAPGARAAVLYAPTWEGAQPSVAYSSVLAQGGALTAALLADERFALVYRPHPLIGVTSREFALADQAIRAAVDAAASADPAAGHAVVTVAQEPLEASFARADVLIADVSAVTSAWLPTRRPLIVTRPPGSAAVDADSGLLAVVPRLVEAERAPQLVAAELADDPGLAARERLISAYLSPYWPDGVMDRFVAVCREAVAERDRLRAALVAKGATGT